MSETGMPQESWNALRACISQGRSPSVAEVDLVAGQIWSDTANLFNEISWSSVPIGLTAHSRAIGLANLALVGTKEPD